jgi:hypothetical protein
MGVGHQGRVFYFCDLQTPAVFLGRAAQNSLYFVVFGENFQFGNFIVDLQAHLSTSFRRWIFQRAWL